MARTRRNRIEKDHLSTERKKWNVPNWENAEDYKYARHLEGDDLRWEFLRRNKEYRNDWNAKVPYAYFKYDLEEWHSPSKLNAPIFDKPCHLVEFSARDPIKQQLHYEALAQTRKIGGLIFYVDLYHPITPQINFIKDIHDKKLKLKIPPEERNKRPNRRSNKNGRSVDTLLRILDAHNEGVPVGEMAEAFGGKDGISKSAMERTIAFAKDFWLKLKDPTF